MDHLPLHSLHSLHYRYEPSFYKYHLLGHLPSTNMNLIYLSPIPSAIYLSPIPSAIYLSHYNITTYYKDQLSIYYNMIVFFMHLYVKYGFKLFH
jgi:hypothetical protein